MSRGPISVCWNITSACNDNCKFCYREKNVTELSYEEKRYVIDQLVEAKVKKITFAGGEPLLVEKIIDLIAYAKEKSLVTSMTTNGILLNGEILNRLDGILDWLTISLDGSSATIQEKMSRNKDHFNTVIHCFELIRKKQYHIKLKINTVVSKQNANDIVNIQRIIKKYNIARWKLFQFVPLRGNALMNSDEFFISDEEYKKIIDSLYLSSEKKDCIITYSGRLNIESAYFVIFPDGDVMISTGLDDKVIGNVLEDKIDSIWDSGGYRKDIHEMRTKFLGDK